MSPRKFASEQSSAVMAGSYNTKRSYLAETLAHRLGIRRWASQTHVIAGLWSAEVLHALRRHPDSFRSLCPDSPDAFRSWWSGVAQSHGQTSTLVLMDPMASTRQTLLIGLEEALDPGTRPRYRGYGEAAAKLISRQAA
jgi:hypothetical protein